MAAMFDIPVTQMYSESIQLILILSLFLKNIGTRRKLGYITF